MTEPVLQVSGLRAYYRTRAFGVTREVRAVDGVDFVVQADEIYGLAGESSCGKSTLIKTIAGAIRPPLTVVEGAIAFRFADRRWSPLEGDLQAWSDVRWKDLSFIMQGSMNVLNPVRRVRHAFVDFAFRHIRKPMPAFLDTVRAHLDRLQLAPAVLDAYPHELSGGMRQRVTIALATVCRPRFIIADEPTTALDVVVQRKVLDMIRHVQRQIGASLIFVTHDLAVHAHLTDRLGIMYAGRLVEEAPTSVLFATPRHPYSRHLIASLPRVGGPPPVAGLEGTPPNLADPPPGCRFHPRCPLAMDVCRRDTPVLRDAAPGHRVACFAVEAGTA
jgi:peptide/nickel transport system ATP-binding protein